MATLVSTIIDKTVKRFNENDKLEVLDGAINDSVTSLVVTFGSRIAVASELQMGAEKLLVTAYVPGTLTATVVRGWDGTTPASHSDSSAIFVDPRIPREDILDLINDALTDMFPEVFAVAQTTFSYSGSIIGYELPAASVDVLRVAGEVDQSSNWEDLKDWQLQTNMPTAEFTSTRAIMLKTALPQGATVNVVYSSLFTPVEAEDDDLEADAGLSSYMTDLPFYFAMSRLLSADEARRSQVDTAQSHQRAQDSPAFLALRTGEWYLARYKDRKINAAATQTKVNRRVFAGSYGS